MGLRWLNTHTRPRTAAAPNRGFAACDCERFCETPATIFQRPRLTASAHADELPRRSPLQINSRGGIVAGSAGTKALHI